MWATWPYVMGLSINVARQRGKQEVQSETETPKELEVTENYPEEGEALILRKVDVGFNESV